MHDKNANAYREILSNQETLATTMNNRMLANERLIRELSKSNAYLIQVIQSLCARFNDPMSNDPSTIVSHSSNSNISNNNSNINTPILIPRSNQALITEFGNVQLTLSANTNTYDMWFVNPLKQISISKLINHWYLSELHKLQPTNYEARRRMHTFASLVFYAKHFMKDNTLIPTKHFMKDNTLIPTKPDDAASKPLWITNVVSNINYSVKAMLEFIPQHSSYKKKAKGDTCAYVYAVLKDLQNIPIEDLPNPVNVIDNATSNAYTYKSEDITSRKSKGVQAA